MQRILLIDCNDSYERIALLEDSELKEIIVEEKNNFRVGDIFIAKVKKILPGKFAFLDLGYEKNAFLGLNDRKQKNLYTYNEKGKPKLNIKEGQDIVVQIDKASTEIKGASVTTNIAITGRYVVLLLNEESISISKKIDDDVKRDFLKNIANENLPKGYGLIFRTNCYLAKEDIIKQEILDLIEKGRNILEKGQYIKAPSCLHFAKTEAEKIAMDILTEEDKIICNTLEKFEFLKANFLNVEFYNGDLPLFQVYSIEPMIDKALHNKVWLKSGGFLVIDNVEAMSIIDVNTGKNISKNFEEMVLKTNLEAVEVILKEVRLRNISGIILIDFIDMKLKENIESVFKHMKYLSTRDRMPINVYPIDELGIMKITRKKGLRPLAEIISKSCPACAGTGRVRNENYVANTIKNQIIYILSNTIYKRVIVSSNLKIINSLKAILNLIEIEEKFSARIVLEVIQTARFDYFNIDKLID